MTSSLGAFRVLSSTRCKLPGRLNRPVQSRPTPRRLPTNRLHGEPDTAILKMRAAMFKRRLIRNLARLCALTPLLFVVYYAAFWLRFEGLIDSRQAELFTFTVGLVIGIKLF